MTLVIPGKTFLAGEYAVLVGGKALGVATKPCFEVNFGRNHFTPLHEKSAAGLFLKSLGLPRGEINSFENNFNVAGFGKSTAEFIATWFHHHEIQAEEAPTFMKKIFNQYRELFDQTSELKIIKPSGADLMIQLLGQITYFDPEIMPSKSLNWVFPEIDFDIISTGIKIATHDHLAALNLKDLEPLTKPVDEILMTYFSVQPEAFLDSLKDWSLKLMDLKLQHHQSFALKQQIEKCPEVMLAKPNGALGADTLTVFYKPEHKNQVRNYFKDNQVKQVTGLENLAKGAHYVD